MKSRMIKSIFIIGALIVVVTILYRVLRNIENKYLHISQETVVQKNIDSQIQDEIQTETKKLQKNLGGNLFLSGKKYHYEHEMEVYLFLGTDASGSEEEKGKKYRGSMADFILLAFLDKTANTYEFLQLNRDTITEVTLMNRDGSGMASADIQLCTAHWYGGSKKMSCKNTVKAVEKLLKGVSIDGYYSIPMSAIKTLNHAIGGVTVTIESDFSNADASLEMGKTLTLNDEQAYHFIHDRVDVGDGENTSRMERQNQYINAFHEKLNEMASNNSAFLLSLYQELSDIAVTNITGKQVSRIAKMVSESQSKGIAMFDGNTKLGKALGDGIEHTEFYIDKTSYVNVMSDIYNIQIGG